MTKVELEIDCEPFEKGLIGISFTGRYDKEDVCGGICMVAPQAEGKVVIDKEGAIRVINRKDMN